jgi:hypothetical protein
LILIVETNPMKLLIRKILGQIRDGTLLEPSEIAALDYDTILDARDSDREFGRQWTQSYTNIENVWKTTEVDQELKSLAEEIRKESFLSVSRSTAQHEISSYVSDDFDIIIRRIILGIDDPFLDKLWSAYISNQIPTARSH